MAVNYKTSLHQHECKNCSKSFGCHWQPEDRYRFDYRQHQEEMCTGCLEQLSGAYSVCPAGAKGFYWAAWTTDEGVWYPAEPYSTGYAASYSDAVEVARAAACNRLAPVEYHQEAADRWRKIERLRNQKARPSKSIGVQVDEFIYHHSPAHQAHDSNDWRDHSCHPHRIIKRTPKFVFIVADCRPCRRFDYEMGGVEIQHKTYRLDRKKLEAGEEVKADRYWWTGYYSISDAVPSDTKPDCPTHLRGAIELFKLPWPCTRKEAAKAYRRMSQERHPDSGGSHEAFIELKGQYDRLRDALA